MGDSSETDIDTGRMQTVKVALVLLAMVSLAAASSAHAKIDTAELKEAMEEAEDVDSALDTTRETLAAWGGDYKNILKGMPPLVLKDEGGIDLAGARDIMGKKVSARSISESAERQSLAKAENRLAAAKQDVHEAAEAKDPVKRAQLEELAGELTKEAVEHIEATKEQ